MKKEFSNILDMRGQITPDPVYTVFTKDEKSLIIWTPPLGIPYIYLTAGEMGGWFSPEETEAFINENYKGIDFTLNPKYWDKMTHNEQLLFCCQYGYKAHIMFEHEPMHHADAYCDNQCDLGGDMQAEGIMH